MTAVTQRGTATTSSGLSNPETVAVPTGTVSGDRVILLVSVDDDGAYTTVTATAGTGKSFTALGHTGGGSGATEWITVFERIWDGTESGTISVAGSTSDHYLAATSWQGAHASNASTLGTFANTASVSAVPAVTNGTADDYTLLCAGTNNIDRSAGAPSGWTRLASIGGAEIDGKAFGASGSTGTVTPSWTGTGEFAAVLVSIPAGGPVATFEQEGYRWRNDDGSETTATWAAAQDSDLTAALGTNVRLRTIIVTDGP